MIFTKWFSVLLLSALSLTLLSGCGTVSGVGKDIQKAGEVIEKEANRAKR